MEGRVVEEGGGGGGGGVCVWGGGGGVEGMMAYLKHCSSIFSGGTISTGVENLRPPTKQDKNKHQLTVTE